MTPKVARYIEITPPFLQWILIPSKRDQDDRALETIPLIIRDMVVGQMALELAAETLFLDLGLQRGGEELEPFIFDAAAVPASTTFSIPSTIISKYF